MGKNILDSKALYMVLSIVIAVSLWFYVVSLDGNEKEKNITNIPVAFTGLEVLESRGLMVVGDPPTVNLRVRGEMSTLAGLSRDGVTLTVDVSKISAPNEYTMGYSFSHSASGSVELVSSSSNNITFEVARYTTRSIEIQGRFIGSAAEGYLAGDDEDFTFSPGMLTVSGQVEQVNQISYVRVTLSGENLTESIHGEQPFELVSNSGEVLRDLDVTLGSDTIHTTFPILATAEVPLTVALIHGGGSNDGNVSWEIRPKSITVAGERAAVDSLKEIILRSIDLSEVRSGDVLTYTIPLADELVNISGNTEAVVNLSFQGLESKIVTTSRIGYIHEPAGWRVKLITQEMPVEIRGTPEALAQIEGEQVRVVVDLDELSNPTAGQFTLSGAVYLDNVGSDAGAVGAESDYRVVVSLSR